MSGQSYYCPYCGQPRDLAWSFCQFCAKSLPEVATASVSQADAVATDHARAHRELWEQAQTQIRARQFDLAEQSLRRFLAERPESAEGIALLGTTYLHRYQLDAAREHLERAVALAPQSPFVRLRMSEYWQALGVTTRAQEELDTALDCAAGNPALYERIRGISTSFRQKTRWSFSHSTRLPRLGAIRARLKAPLQLLHLKRADERSI